MPDDPKQIATTDPNGYVKIELNAPAGAVVTQPLAPPPPVPPPFQPIAPAMTVGSPAVPSESESQQKLEQAKAQQQSAQQSTQAALEQVKSVEESAAEQQGKLAEEAKDAQAKLEQAQRDIRQAQKQQKETEQKLQELKKKQRDESSSKTIAGYKPSDFFQAFVKPPQPSSGGGSSALSMDKETQQQLEKQSKEMTQELSRTQKQVQQANKQIGQAQKQAEKTNKKQSSMLQNIIKLIDSLQGKAEQTSRMAKAYLPFMVLGSLFLLISILTLLFAKSSLWVLIAMAALVQLGLSGMLKKRSQ